MAGHTFFGKQKLCYTEVSDFTDFQGIGSDPMYKRYDSVFSVIKRAVPTHLQHFLATPEYIDDYDQICWHIDIWTEQPTRLSDLSGTKYEKYKRILNDTISAYKTAAMNMSGDDLNIMAGVIKHIDDNLVFCCDDKVYLVAWGMTPDAHKHVVVGSVIHVFDYVKKFKILFDPGEYGTISKLDKSISRAEGVALCDTDIPIVNANEGWKFLGWSPSPIGHIVSGDTTFVAQYEKEEIILPPPPIVEDPQPEPEPEYECRFDAGEHGTLDGVSSFTRTYGSSIAENELPIVIPKKGYKFVGWDKPLGRITRDTVFVAQYKRDPWYKRLWVCFTGKGCLEWLLWFLLILFLLFLLLWLLKGCNGCTRTGTAGGPTGPGCIVTPRGDTIDYYGPAKPITGGDGSLPDDVFRGGGNNGVLPGGGIAPGTGSGVGIVAPIHGDNGSFPPVVTNPELPGAPDVISNRLNIFFEDANADLKGFSKALHAVFPEVEIIAGDPNIPMLQIRIPEGRRDEIRESLNKKLPNYDFFVVDESIFGLSGDKSVDSSSPGWHLGAIHLKDAWNVTQGSSNVVVAVVDDGFDTEHEMIKGRIVSPYNVFSQSTALSLGSGHGTHVAGLAVGFNQKYSNGYSGVAPNCKLMPIQVFDNDKCTFSALASGIMYAIHHGADVVNVSVGPNFNGLDVVPVSEQEKIAQVYFKNEERVWRKIFEVAREHNAIIIFAGGNDNILATVPPNNRTNQTINVAAIDKSKSKTSFTNYNEGTNISAPGQGIFSSVSGNKYEAYDGTSMAAPIVSGIVALMRSIKPDLTVSEAICVLQTTGECVSNDIPPMVRADRAVDAVQQGDIPSGCSGYFTPCNPSDSADVPDASGSVDGDNYDEIRKMIEFYKKKIEELEKQLPKN